jgi:hypothetical protein
MKLNITSSRLLLLVLITGVGIFISACKKFVDVKPSTNLIQTKDLFASDAAALSAVAGVYTQMRATLPALANGALSIYAGLASDELATSSTSLEYDAFYNNSISPTSTIINTQLWSSSYRIIYQTNLTIENLEKSTQISKTTQQQLLGEMEVVRSLYYFYLTNVFGDVPLITSSNYSENQYKPRTATDSIYQQIVHDLQDAESLLSTEYPSDYKARPNSWTAAALLAKVYLYQSNWQGAKDECSKIINSQNYNLESDLTEVFKNTSNETIWQIAPANESRNTVEGSVFIPFSSDNVPTIFATKSLINSFEPGDLRKNNWLELNSISGNNFYYPFKYKERTNTPVDEYDIVFRLGEIYLIRAEASAHLNNIADATADLNIIRNRAGLSNYNATDQTSLISAIMKERQTELFAEWGNRWFDLKRTDLADSILSAAKNGNWQSTDMLFPLPLSEIQINTYLVQNPGY